MGDMELPELECVRCGHTWYPRRPVKPGVCPQCKREDWEK